MCLFALLYAYLNERVKANMGKEYSFSKDLMSVVGSNIIILVSSIVTGFVVPKVLGVQEYGLYKIFTLYLSYSALMHVGFVDGILLTFAGYDYDNLPKEKFRRYTHFFFCFQSIVALAIISVAITILSHQYKVIFVLLAIDILAINMTAYYQYISQSTMRFLELSVRKILLSVLKIVLVLILLVVSKLSIHWLANAYFYVGGLVAIDVGLVVWYFLSYKDISIGKKSNMSFCKDDIIHFFKQGIILTVAYQASMVIFSLDRQFVSVLFDTETYGVYSFAYSIISMVTTVVSAVSFVLFPRLKQLSKETIMGTFSKAMASISIISVAAMMGYQPLCILIKIILSEYVDSIEYLRIIIPGLALSCCINIIMFTYYKALDAHYIYFKLSCIVLVLSAILNYLAYKMGGTPVYISIVSVISLLIWYFLSESYFIKNYNIKWKKNMIYISVSMVVFYLITFYIDNYFISWCVFSLYFVLATFALYKELVFEICHKFRS